MYKTTDFRVPLFIQNTPIYSRLEIGSVDKLYRLAGFVLLKTILLIVIYRGTALKGNGLPGAEIFKRMFIWTG